MIYMTSFDYTGILTQAVDELSDSQSYKGLFHQHKDGDPLPSAKSLYKIVELARSILSPDILVILLSTVIPLLIT